MSEAYSVKLEQFEGPLDLLLHLTKKHEIDLYNLSVSEVTDQYLAYMAAADDLNLDLAGEFLVMAATLIYLKSRALLPPEEREELEDEEPIDPELQLLEQLREHERFRKVGEALAAREVLGRDIFERTVVEMQAGRFLEPPKPMVVDDLLGALQRMLDRRSRNLVHQVQGERLSLRDGVESVVEQLRARPRMRFEELFPEDASRLRIVVTFLAILELVKAGAVTATQSESHAEIDILLVRDIDADEIMAIDDVDPDEASEEMQG
ncbi:MAG: segregation/condensation protein A [Deltaproteobacteria bacterium]